MLAAAVNGSAAPARRGPGVIRRSWRDVRVPLAVWIAIALGVVGAASYSVAAERSRVEDDFQLRTEASAGQVASSVTLLQEQMAQRAAEVLAGQEVSSASLQAVLFGLGFEQGGLFDEQGRYVTGTTFNPELVGVDLTDRLDHVAVTVREGRPAVSGVLPSRGLGSSIVGISAPYATPDGPRIIAGGMTLQGGVFDDVLADNLRLAGVESAVVDADGTVIAVFGGDAPATPVSLAEFRPGVATASAEAPSGRYADPDGTESYFSRVEVDGTDWVLVAHGETNQVFAGVVDLRRTAIVLTAGLLGLGLVLVVVGARDRRRRREQEETIRRLNRDLEDLVEVRTSRLREALRHSEEMNEQLEAALTVREDILAATGHELRTPLTPIQGLLELIDSRWDQLDRRSLRDYHDVIARNAERLSDLVEELLQASQIRGSDIVATPEPVEARPAVLDALVRRDETLDVAVDGDDVAVWCQPDHLHQILEILLDNAVTHGEPPYRVQISIHESDVAIQVTDEGPGVDPATRPDMFDPFSQGSTGDTRTVHGLGLGLPIARALARANGGRLSYRPGPTGGAAFVLQLDAVIAGQVPDDGQRPSADRPHQPQAPAATVGDD